MASLASRLLARGRVWSWHVRQAVLQAVAPRRKVLSRGLTFTLQCDNWVTHYRWRTYNTKEPETLDWLDARMRDGDTLFDVGANIGVYTLYAACRHPKARIVAFEPEYANLHLLRDNIVANRLQDRVTIYSIALGNRGGISYLHLQDLRPGAALHSVSNEVLTVTRAGRPVVWREGVMSLPLDAFCEQTDQWPNCIKIDVDGTEREVLEGGRRTLSAPEFRTVLIEMPDDGAERAACVRLLEAAGLRRRWRDPSGASANEVWARES